MIDKAKDNHAYAIELPFWQAPNDYVLVEAKRDELCVTCNIWRKNQPGNYTNSVGKMEFSSVWATRWQRHKHLDYYPYTDENGYKSCYWVVHNSYWLKELTAERENHDPEWKKHDIREYKHYIVQSHTFYLEIIAGNLNISKKMGRKI